MDGSDSVFRPDPGESVAIIRQSSIIHAIKYVIKYADQHVLSTEESQQKEEGDENELEGDDG